MNSSHRRQSILWLTKNGFNLYINNEKNLISFSFDPSSVKYLEVADETKFSSKLESFINQNNLNYLDTYFIVGPDALFEKEFVKSDEEALENFIETIPYEEVFSKKLIKENSIVACGFNANLFHLINSGWENHTNKIISVLPYQLVNQNSLNLENEAMILKKAETLKNESMVKNEEQEGRYFIPTNKVASTGKSTLPLLIPVFLVLLLVLAFVILNSQKQPNLPTKSITATPTIIVIPSPTIFTMPSVASPSAVPTL